MNTKIKIINEINVVIISEVFAKIIKFEFTIKNEN